MNKTNVIVGGSSGIGLACVKLLANEGDHVISFSRSEINVIDLPNVEHFTVDVCDEDTDLFFLPDRIDSLVYCPGTINIKPFNSLSISEFKEDYEINVLGLVRVLQSCINKLKSSNSSSVVMFSTVAVSQGMSYHSSIASAKGAIEGLTRSLAAEYASAGIRFNAIAPSLVNTPLAKQFTQSSVKLEAISKRHPLNRIGNPDEIAALVKYLVSDASTWMTGQIIGLDGGLSSIKAMN